MAYPPYTGKDFVSPLHNDIYPAIDPACTPLSQPSKVILITGAGRGIGRSIALTYASASVSCIYLCSRTASELSSVSASIKAINPSIRVYEHALDVASEPQVLALAEAVRKEEGRLDVLINNAGTGDPWVPLAESVASDYWRTLTVNLYGPYLLLHSLLPLMVHTAKEHGIKTDIINISSMGSTVVVPGASSYQISKLALNRLTEFVAAEYGDKGINCVAVNPGGVRTELTKGMPEQFKARLTNTPELCAGFVVWLTAGEHGAWLGGRYVSATWDVEALVAKREEIVKGDKLKFRMVV